MGAAVQAQPYPCGREPFSSVVWTEASHRQKACIVDLDVASLNIARPRAALRRHHTLCCTDVCEKAERTDSRSVMSCGLASAQSSKGLQDDEAAKVLIAWI